MRRAAVLVLALLAPLAMAPDGLAIEGVSQSEGIVFSADYLTYDSETRIVRATGAVKASQAERVIVADEIQYDEAKDLVTAKGNITLFEPSGEVTFADEMELTGDLKAGVIANVRIILADGARLAAAEADRTEGNKTTAHKAVYSPCFLCPTDPDTPLLWQVKAVKVVHQQDDKIIEFYDARLEIADVPVFYLPYFYTPDPTVKRKSGFLIPTVGQSSDLGFLTQIPYYWVISPYSDMTITPWFMTEEGVLLEAEYRQRLQHGKIRTEGMITRDSRDQIRGFINSQIRYDIDETWRAGIDARRTTNSTFPRTYGDLEARTLTQQGYAEGFFGNDYLSANAIAFQGLDDEDKQSQIPVAAPWIDYQYVSRPDRLGGITNVRLDGLALTRDDGNDTRRLSARANWQLPFAGPIGDIYTVSLALWGDGYDVSDLQLTNGSDFNGTQGRVVPMGSLSWSLPLISTGETLTQIIEPRVELVGAPNYGNPQRIPNEDSQDFELEDTNVFGLRRYPGLDRVEEGSRVNYGVKWQGLGGNWSNASVFVGQVYRFRDDNTFPDRSGIEGNVSDFVSAVQYSPGPYVDLIYRNRFGSTDFDMHRQEITSSVGVPAIRVDTTYVNYQGQPNVGLDFREEVNFGLNTKWTRYWRNRIFGTYEFSADSWRTLGTRLTYEDECMFFSAEVRRRNIRDQNLQPSTGVFFRVGFKTLGNVGGGFSP